MLELCLQTAYVFVAWCLIHKTQGQLYRIVYRNVEKIGHIDYFTDSKSSESGKYIVRGESGAQSSEEESSVHIVAALSATDPAHTRPDQESKSSYVKKTIQ
jgi:hypothetical protein